MLAQTQRDLFSGTGLGIIQQIPQWEKGTNKSFGLIFKGYGMCILSILTHISRDIEEKGMLSENVPSVATCCF
jgi:hypothetical protein